jgi:glycosyltransferase involved in cell wall biosynthesis
MDRGLRVLCVTPTGPEGRGGIDRLFRYLGESGALSCHGAFDVRYFASRGPDLGKAWALLFPWRVIVFVATLVLWRPAVVHLNFATGGSLLRKLVLARIAHHGFGAAVVIHFHGQFPTESIAAGTLPGRLFLALCGSADAVVALGRVSEIRFREAAGVAAAKLHVVPNGIPDFASGVARPKARSGPLRLAFVGKVGDHKGVPILVRALSLLPRDRDWTCVITGDGEVERCAALSRDAGLSDRVRFLGWTESRTVHKVLIDTDVVVLPSLSENMPLSLIEGSCAGAALIATAVGDVGEIVVHGGNGFLVERNADAVAAAILRLLDDPAILAAMQSASRQRYEAGFALGAMAERLGRVYRSVARGPRGEGQRHG